MSAIASIESYPTAARVATDPLAVARPRCYRLTMFTLGRVLQSAGLSIPLLAIFAQLNDRITLGQMLRFLVAAICIFTIGYLLQRYSGGSAP
jgi:hypothetical protein